MKLRALVADDDAGVFTIFREHTEEIQDLIHADFAESVEAAKSLIESNVYDVAFVDYMLAPNDDYAGGVEVLRHLGTHSPSTVPVIMTKFHEKYQDWVYGRPFYDSSAEARVLRKSVFLSKIDPYTGYFRAVIEEIFNDRLRVPWSVPGEESLSDLVAAIQSRRKHIPGLRKNTNAVVGEVQRLLYRLFNGPASSSLGRLGTRLSVDLMRPGRSASCVASVCLMYGDDAEGNPIVGNRVVVKFGPRQSISHESDKYVEFVQLGVPSEFRVEMIGAALGDALGAICYSFAGSGSDSDIRDLDSLIETGDVAGSVAVLGRLFDPGKKSWDAIVGDPMKLTQFYRRNFPRSDVLRNTDLVRQFAASLKFGDVDERASTFILRGGGRKLRLPERKDFGQPRFLRNYATCLQHGDLHGGNVLVREDGQIRLIDFATAGLGPRFADAAALAVTLRIVPRKESSEALSEAVFREFLRQEKEVLEHGGGDPTRELFPWQLVARELNALALSNGIRPGESDQAVADELLLTQYVYILNVFSAIHLGKSDRMHLLAWLLVLRSRLGVG